MTESTASVADVEQARLALLVLGRAEDESAPREVVIASVDGSAVLPRRVVTLLKEVLVLIVDGREVIVRRTVPEYADRPSCSGCGEPIELAGESDPESWIHAFDANDRGDHSAWIEELKEHDRRTVRSHRPPR